MLFNLVGGPTHNPIYRDFRARALEGLLDHKCQQHIIDGIIFIYNYS